MKVAIMQPYFFPYLGYFQLIAAVDVFVIFDDVNYINRGWINRNNILANGRAQPINLALGNRSQNLWINQIDVADTGTKLLKTLAQNYGKAPYFQQEYPMLEAVIQYPDKNLGNYLTHLLKAVCAALGIQTPLMRSSDLRKDNTQKGQAKILAICEQLQATQYINPIGGKELYQREIFSQHAVDLSFLRTRDVSYPQGGLPFVPSLSIIDVLMFNGPVQRHKLLAEYDLV